MKIRPAAKRGYIFIASLIALTVMFILGVTSMQVSRSTADVAARARYDSEALMIATAAVEAGEAYLRSQSSPPINEVRYPASGTKSLAGGTFYVRLRPIQNPFDQWSKYWVATGFGTNSNGYSRTVTTVLRPQSFSLYGYFEDTGLSNNWWVAGLSKFEGPFHTNGQMQIDWRRSGAANDIIFRGTAESVNSSVKWGSAGAPRSEDEWKNILTGGRSAMSLGVDSIPFPTSSGDQKTAAQNGLTSNQLTSTNSGYPDVYMTNNGVSPDAGIYINSGGQSCGIGFSVGAGNEQIVTITHKIKQGSYWVDKITEITVDLAAGATKQRTKTGTGAWTSPELYTGVPNGVIYCNGEITSLEGQLADSYVSNGKIVRANTWTVATDFSPGNKNITITDNLTYKTPPDLTRPMTDPVNLKSAALGVLGSQIRVSGLCPNDLTLHGVFMATSTSTGGSMRVLDIDNKRLRGNLYILGGTIVKTAAILGQYNTSTKSMVYGYNEHYSYDPRMASGPLTAFPKTNQYDVVSWQYE